MWLCRRGACVPWSSVYPSGRREALGAGQGLREGNQSRARSSHSECSPRGTGSRGWPAPRAAPGCSWRPQWSARDLAGGQGRFCLTGANRTRKNRAHTSMASFRLFLMSCTLVAFSLQRVEKEKKSYGVILPNRAVLVKTFH